MLPDTASLAPAIVSTPRKSMSSAMKGGFVGAQYMVPGDQHAQPQPYVRPVPVASGPQAFSGSAGGNKLVIGSGTIGAWGTPPPADQIHSGVVAFPPFLPSLPPSFVHARTHAVCLPYFNIPGFGRFVCRMLLLVCPVLQICLVPSKPRRFRLPIGILVFPCRHGLRREALLFAEGTQRPQG